MRKRRVMRAIFIDKSGNLTLLIEAKIQKVDKEHLAVDFMSL
jgi:hypothetical protein